MKRLLLTLAAAASAAAVAVGGVAQADPGHDRAHDRGGERSGGGWSRGGDRGSGERGSGDRGPVERAPERGGGDWQRGRGAPGRGWSEAPPPESYVPYPPQGRGYGAPRRGGYMSPQYRGEPLQDYGRYRLRPPPRGYTWMRVGGSYVLMSMSTGQIFDVVPY